MRSWSRRKLSRRIAAAGAAMVMLGGGVFVGATFANAAPSELKAGQLQQVHFFSDNAPKEFTLQSWRTLFSQSVPGGSWVRMVRVRLTGVSSCWMTEATSEGHCAVQISIGGSWAAPSSGIHYHFDDAAIHDNRETHTMEVSQVFPTGAGEDVKVVIQAQPRNDAKEFVLDDWSVSIEVFS
jgi:hypothetical protein